MQEVTLMWTDVIRTLGGGKDILLFSTATTGLKPGRDELIALSYNKIAEDGSVVSDTIFRGDADADLLDKSNQYHSLSASILCEKGLDGDDFGKAIADVMKDCTCLTYRPSFQYSFLDSVVGHIDGPYTHLYDLPLLVKGAASKMMFDELEEANTLVSLEKFLMSVFKTSPSIKSVCERFSISYDVPPSVYPVEHYADCLLALWSKVLANMSFDCQEDLLE